MNDTTRNFTILLDHVFGAPSPELIARAEAGDIRAQYVITVFDGRNDVSKAGVMLRCAACAASIKEGGLQAITVAQYPTEKRQHVMAFDWCTAHAADAIPTLSWTAIGKLLAHAKTSADLA